MIFFLNKISYWLLLLICVMYFEHSLQETTDSSLNDCLPQLADMCFKKLSMNLDCHESYMNKCGDSNEFCKLLDDSLKCSDDIINSDCSKLNGTDNFKSWYKGFRAIYSYLCVSENSSVTNGASDFLDLKKSKCWNKEIFVNCVGNLLNIYHVVDLLKTSYNYSECLRMVIAMTSCNVNSQSVTCASGNEVFINDLVLTFFSEHKCNDFEQKSSSTKVMSSNYMLMSIIVIMIFSGFN